MSDADNQTGGTGDPNFDQAQTKGPQQAESSSPPGDENDNDVMTDDDLPAGG